MYVWLWLSRYVNMFVNWCYGLIRRKTSISVFVFFFQTSVIKKEIASIWIMIIFCVLVRTRIFEKHKKMFFISYHQVPAFIRISFIALTLLALYRNKPIKSPLLCQESRLFIPMAVCQGDYSLQWFCSGSELFEMMLVFGMRHKWVKFSVSLS